MSLFLTGCVTGSTLRTARVLEKGHFEISGGVAGSIAPTVLVNQAVMGAYGFTNWFELEARYEDDYLSLTPRLQLTKSESLPFDSLTFFEVGFREHGRVQFGPGIMIGKRWNFFEPYLSYRFRYFTSISQKDRNRIEKHYFDDLGPDYLQYLKFGSRFYLYSQNRPTQPKMKWFIGLEIGPTFWSHKDITWESAINIGFDY